MDAASIKFIAALASFGIIILLVVLDTPKVTPGPLTPVHARQPELQGLGGCSACHGEGEQSMADACFACHEDIARDIELGKGLHGGQLTQPVGQCGECHLEHHGDAIPLAGELAFERAGFESPASFEHSHVGFQLEGVHASLSCEACHPGVLHAWLPDGVQRYGGLVGDCESCHENPHETPMVRGCEDCHGQSKPFALLDGFAHPRDYPLIGGHANLGCAACHSGTHTVEALASDQPPTERTCSDCHDSPHSVEFLEADGTGAGCSECHSLTDWLSADLSIAQHERSGFSLADPHGEVGCIDCHAPGVAFDSRFPGRVQDDCASCHSDPHEGQFAESSLSSCVACHGYSSFADCSFGVEEHSRTSFPLTGAHEVTECQACHGPTLTNFRGLTSTCSGCHADAHRGALEDSCDKCHSTASFQEIHALFDHLGATGFPLDGAHGQAACESCHPRSQLANSHGRTFGFVEEHFPGDTRRCATCHQDVHQGAFGALDCGECHGLESFEVVPTFDHAAAGFPLLGAHAQAACSSCHPADDSAPRGFALASEHFGGRNCASCHQDPHEPSLGADCSSCHDTLTFRSVTRGFDHGADTGFALTGVHAQASCAACHPAQLEGPRSFGRARGTSCAHCHTDPHAGQFQGEDGATDCARCHLQDRPWSEISFDHGASAFPLDATHASVACAACHLPATLRSGQEAVRYKPIPHGCADCHLEEREDRR